MFLFSLEKNGKPLSASLAQMGWTCQSAYYSLDTEVTLLTDMAPLAPADSCVCNPYIRGTVGGEGREGRLGTAMQCKAHHLWDQKGLV